MRWNILPWPRLSRVVEAPSIDLVSEKVLRERPYEGGCEMEAKRFVNVHDLFGLEVGDLNDLSVSLWTSKTT